MFRIRPVLRYASRKVSDPRVKNAHCPSELACKNLTERHQKPSSPMLQHRTWRLDEPVSRGFSKAATRTCHQKPLEPHAKCVLASGYTIRQAGYQKCLELILRVTTDKRSDQASGGGTGDDTRKKVRIQKCLDYPEMIYASCESVAGMMKSTIIVQYPNEAPPERQRAVAPRLVLMLR